MRNRPAIAVATARHVFCALALLAGGAFAPRQVLADITYTWTEDDNVNGVSGDLVVKAAAQAAGQIALADVVSFHFTIPGLTFTTSELFGNFPLAISTLDASPTSGSSQLHASEPSGGFAIRLNAQYNSPNAEVWSNSNNSGVSALGDGHWTITGAAVAVAAPEPSSAAVAAFGAVCAIAYGWTRRRQGQRRKASPAMPGA